MVGATRRVAQYRAARRAAPTFRNDEVEAQSRSEQDRWTFYETINICYFYRRAFKGPDNISSVPESKPFPTPGGSHSNALPNALAPRPSRAGDRHNGRTRRREGVGNEVHRQPAAPPRE